MSYEVITQYLTPNKYSRPGYKLRKVRGLIIHWVANPNTSAKGNRDFFESRKGGLKSYGSAHELIDLDGDVVVALPPDELAYQAGSSQPYKPGTKQIYTPVAWEKLNSTGKPHLKPYPNDCTYGIECCHIDWNGKMTGDTYNSLVERCVHWCKYFNLDPLTDIYTHQEVVGWKDCHRWFVNNPVEWKKFKQLVSDKMNNKVKVEDEPMTAEEKAQFKALVDKVGELEHSKDVLKASLTEQRQTIVNQQTEIDALKNKLSMAKVPSYALPTIEKLKNMKDKNGNPVMNTPEGRSADLYATVTMFDRMGVIDFIKNQNKQ
ncbi:N-acetylmuramoyl-L-alanine amidase family protein [Paenibacillus sp. JSM ZJ436]|uniref:N-acetylmuramoyl-L-alanine amidase family protein n=1 Tax=Paenibacillus sp. JSM ZJ436 TaxID=3376190 RepID=UPI0037B95336